MNSLTDSDTLDIVGPRKDGGLDLVISARGPIDGSPETLSLLESKIRSYLTAAKSEMFLRHYGRDRGVPVSIYIACPYAVAPAALALVEKMRAFAKEEGVCIEIRKYMGEMHG